MKLAELKSLNPNKPGTWPWSVKIMAFALIFVAVVVAGAFLLWQDQWDKLARIKKEEETLKSEYLVKKAKAINLDLIKKQLNETKLSLSALLKQLPSKSEMDALLTDINQAGLGRGLQFELFKPGKEAVSGSFAELPITIKVTGSYDDIGKFSSDIASLPRIVTLNDISINTMAKGSGLSMDAVAKTYRYVEAAAAPPPPAKKAPAKAPAKTGGHGHGVE